MWTCRRPQQPKLFGGSDPRIEGGVTPQELASTNATVELTLGSGWWHPDHAAAVSTVGCVGGRCLRVGLMPDELFPTTGAAYREAAATALIARSTKPTFRDRLRLDRYDDTDFDELRTAMKADHLWFL